MDPTGNFPYHFSVPNSYIGPGDGGVGFGGYICIMDGVQTDCGMVVAALGSEAAVQCPNNNCDPVYDSGQWLPFGGWADGSSGYMPMSLAGFSTLDASNAAALVTNLAPKLGQPVDPTSLTGQGAVAYKLLLALGVAPEVITIYQNNGGGFSAVLSPEGFQALLDSGEIQFHAGDAFMHYPYTNGTRDENPQNSLHAVWFDPILTDYVGGSGVYMEFHVDADNPWSGSMWNHLMCALFKAGC